MEIAIIKAKKEEIKMEGIKLISLLEINGKIFKVEEITEEGLITETDGCRELSKGKLTGKFIFPYNCYSEIVIENLKLNCGIKEGKCICRFKDLSSNQKEIFKTLIEGFKKEKIIFISSKKMNYIRDESLEKKLLKLSKVDKIKRIGIKISAVLVGGFALALVSLNALHRENSVKVSIKAPGESKKPKEAVIKTPPSPSHSKPLSPPASPPKKTQATKKEEKLSRGKTYYCIQLVSGRNLKNIKEKIKNLNAPYLRVERFGKYYAVRVGFFKNPQETAEILKSLKRKFKDAFVRTCYYKPERWVK